MEQLAGSDPPGADRPSDTPAGGPRRRIYDEPVNRFVAGFIGRPPMNFLDAGVARDGAVVEGRGFAFAAGSRVAAALKGRYSKIGAGVRPEHLRPVEGEPSRPSAIDGRIELIEPLGSQVMIQVATAAGLVTAQFERRAGLTVGQPVRLGQVPDMLHVFDALSGRSVLAV